MTATRQALDDALLQVEIVGNTINAGASVTVFSNSGSGVAQYVVTDRTTAQKYGIFVADGAIGIVATASAASAEPIVLDTLLSSTYWKIFVDNGMIGWESTVTVQNDVVLLADTVTSTTRKLVISDGALGTTVVTSTTETFSFDDNDAQVGSVLFSSIDGITTAGITNGFISIRAITPMGQPLNQEISVGTNVPVRFYTQNGRIRMKKPGQEEVSDYKIIAEPDLDLQNNDIAYVLSGAMGITFGQLDFVERFWDFEGVTHHTEAIFMDL